MKKDQLSIYYYGIPNFKMERMLKYLLGLFGYSFITGGYDHLDKIRDMTFGRGEQ